MPEKSGIDAVARLRSCANAGQANRAAAETVTMINVRVMEFSRFPALPSKTLPSPIVCRLCRLYTDSPAGKHDQIPADHRMGGQAMESVIAKLIQDFEQGKMNRRQLIQSLSLAAVASAAAAPAAIAAGKPLEALYVNHISYSVNDYKKVRDFYVDLLGMKITEDDGKQCRLLFGNNILIPRSRANGG